MEGPAGVGQDPGREIEEGGWREGGSKGRREAWSKGHSCRGLMPRVEELELQPRNVPQRPLKREGVQRKRRARASDVSWTAQSL